MALIARILGVSLLTSALVAGLGLVLLNSVSGHADYAIPVFFLACVGGGIGAVAGAAREIVSAQRQKVSNWPDT